MREFIISKLIEIQNQELKYFDFQYKCDNDDLISIKGKTRYGVADFIIERLKSDGHKCSSIPVYQMPLVEKCINEIAEQAMESL